MKRTFSLTGLLFFATVLLAQQAYEEIDKNPCLAGSNYLAYPAPQKALTPAPEGKSPFYVSHYGRHGSRYLIDRKDYTSTLDILEKAATDGMLTETGLDVLRRVRLMAEESENRYGELTELGALQHRQIARRMYERFPEIFADSAIVDAKSTVIIRCILSMENELQELVALNPKIRLRHDASEHDMYYMNLTDRQLTSKRRDEAIKESLGKWEKEHIDPAPLMRRLLNDTAYVADPSSLCMKLFKLANILQNSELRHEFTLYDIFTTAELYALWQYNNIGWFNDYACNEWNGGTQPYTQRNLLAKIVSEADSCLALEKPGATLRFGHETMVLPLTCLMNLNGYGDRMNPLEAEEKGWINYRIFPMGANIQLVFYRANPADSDVWVKILLNEEEATLPIVAVEGPYYRWAEARQYFLDKLSQYTAGS